MNNRPVEQALGILVPTDAGDYPEKLLNLPLSLVAQSQSLSSSLKPEEEIARPYACAGIACRRPRSSPSRMLTGLAALTRSPSKVAPTPRGLQNTPSKSTSLKRSVSVANKLNSPSESPRKSITAHPRGITKSTIVPGSPAWAMAAIRTICKTLATPAPRTTTWSRPPISRTLPPLIFPAVSSILFMRLACQ
ncbi:uncharacterized protein N7469_003261 [Penicillium citrinum]|uniref:ORC6 first cyclin-like domain-containing protein n=1 Tax=Penicillium citrinum TaxID=5077 RepID=A0A9W9PC00_PENCI|nr:uncharacterized protein N7469_003261 [Penicillium citrinum]KAJ5241670.1 hypothetical protein N7469_003261 [Penicillium citrinum]